MSLFIACGAANTSIFHFVTPLSFLCCCLAFCVLSSKSYVSHQLASEWIDKSPHASCMFCSYRKRASPLPKDDHSSGVKDCLLANSSDPVELRRLNYQTPGNTQNTIYRIHTNLSYTHTMCNIFAYFHMRSAATHILPVSARAQVLHHLYLVGLGRYYFLCEQTHVSICQQICNLP